MCWLHLQQYQNSRRKAALIWTVWYHTYEIRTNELRHWFWFFPISNELQQQNEKKMNKYKTAKVSANWHVYGTKYSFGSVIAYRCLIRWLGKRYEKPFAYLDFLFLVFFSFTFKKIAENIERNVLPFHTYIYKEYV